MTKLKEEMTQAIANVFAVGGGDEHAGRAAAEVAKKYIEEAYRDGVFWRERYCEFEGATDKDYEEHCQDSKEKWLKENGII